MSIYEGVELEDDVFCGPSMVFTNVMNPRSHVSRKTNTGGRSCGAARRSAPTRRSSAASTLGEYAFVGAGAVVTKDVPAYALDGRRAGAAHRLDVPVRRAAARQRRRDVRGVRHDVRAGRRSRIARERWIGTRRARK